MTFCKLHYFFGLNFGLTTLSFIVIVFHIFLYFERFLKAYIINITIPQKLIVLNASTTPDLLKEYKIRKIKNMITIIPSKILIVPF